MPVILVLPHWVMLFVAWQLLESVRRIFYSGSGLTLARNSSGETQSIIQKIKMMVGKCIQDHHLNPRSSFKAFLEVVKSMSLPWEVSEINAIHSLQLIMRESFQDIEDSCSKALIYAQQSDTEMQEIDELSSAACEMVRLIEMATAPIFGVDTDGLINVWNSKVAELIGLQFSQAMGKSMVHDIAHEDSRGVVENLLRRALQGVEDRNVELKLKKFGPHQQNSVVYIVTNACTSRDYVNNIIGVCFVGQDITSEKLVMDKFIRLQGDYEAIIQSLNPLNPPIFASDENACCSEWNAAMEKLTGWARQEVIGKVLPRRIFGGLCQLKGQDSLTKFMILLYQAISGQDNMKLPFGVFNREGKFVEVFLIANKRTDADEKVIGCFCFLQTIEPDPSGAEEKHKQEDRESFLKHRELAYIRQEMKNPLNGIRFTYKLLESTAMSEYQKQFLDTSGACERHIMMIIEDVDFEKIQEGDLLIAVVLNMDEFRLGNVIAAIISQVMISLRERNIQLLHEIPEEMKTLSLYGDQIRLQLILSDFLHSGVHHAPSPNGWVEIKILPGLKLIQDGNEYIRLQLRMTHPGPGLPPTLVQDMFDRGNQLTKQEGLGLNLSRKLLNRMNGHVHYARELNKCYFLIDLEMKLGKGKHTGSQTDSSRVT